MCKYKNKNKQGKVRENRSDLQVLVGCSVPLPPAEVVRGAAAWERSEICLPILSSMEIWVYDGKDRRFASQNFSLSSF